MANEFTPTEQTKNRQQLLMLKALRKGPLASLEARELLGILHPAGRVLELRRNGFAIDTRKVTCRDAEGRDHTCAEYVLEPETES